MEATRKSPAGQAGQSHNTVVQGKDNQNPLTVQEIFRRAKVQRTRLINTLSKSKAALNMRQLSNITGIERPTICRRIAELLEDGIVEVSHYGVCPISKYPKVGFYAYVNKGGDDGDSKA